MGDKANYVTCPEGHKIFVIWSDERQLFAFTCDECDTHSEVAASVHGPIRIQSIKSMDDTLNQLDVKAFLKAAEKEMFPKMQGSAISINFLGKPDAKLCLETGASVLFDKPIIVVVPEGGGPVPVNLKRCASAVLEGRMDDPRFAQRLQQAIKRLITHDRRAQ
jgi:hypothetical protein